MSASRDKQLNHLQEKVQEGERKLYRYHTKLRELAERPDVRQFLHIRRQIEVEDKLLDANMRSLDILRGTMTEPTAQEKNETHDYPTRQELRKMLEITEPQALLDQLEPVRTKRRAGVKRRSVLR